MPLSAPEGTSHDSRSVSCGCGDATRRDRGPIRPAAEHETSEVALEEDGITEVGRHLLTCGQCAATLSRRTETRAAPWQVAPQRKWGGRQPLIYRMRLAGRRCEVVSHYFYINLRRGGASLLQGPSSSSLRTAQHGACAPLHLAWSPLGHLYLLVAIFCPIPPSPPNSTSIFLSQFSINRVSFAALRGHRKQQPPWCFHFIFLVIAFPALNPWVIQSRGVGARQNDSHVHQKTTQNGYAWKRERNSMI